VQRATASGDDLGGHRALARIIDRHHCRDDFGRHAVVLADSGERSDVLGKTGSSEAGAYMQELSCDAAIEPHPARHLLHIRPALFAKVRHFVDEGDLGRQKSVGCVFDQLRGATLGEENRRLVDEQRPVQFAHHAPRPFIVGTDHDAIRALEILNCRALTQKLRIRHDSKVCIGAPTGTVDLMATTV
jgi:hypothetical protein